MPLADCRLINLPKVPNLLGNLTFIEGDGRIPLASNRYDEADYYRNYNDFPCAMTIRITP